MGRIGCFVYITVNTVIISCYNDKTDIFPYLLPVLWIYLHKLDCSVKNGISTKWSEGILKENGMLRNLKVAQ